MGETTLIDKSIGDIDKLDRAKIGLEFMAHNMEQSWFTVHERRLLVQHFNERLLGDDAVSRDYTS